MSSSSSTSPNKPKLADTSQQAFTECLNAVAHDMPMLMHGSGDVLPQQVNSESVQLLSELTTHYISNLVQAAIDAHQILNNGPQPLPPPPLNTMGHVKPPLPTPPADITTMTSSSNSNGTSSSSSNTKKEKTTHRKRRRATDEFWDEPLADPKIKGQAAAASSSSNKPAKPTFQGVPVDDWVGVAGVDFWESSRARKAHVRRAITTQSFIFPICHDVGLYGRVLEVQTARRSIAPTLVDPVVMDVVRTEGASQGPGALRKRDKPLSSSSRNEEETEEPEDTDSEGEDGATWPGLEYLLPVHVLKDFGK
jgi:hypothetical protein